MGQKRDNQTRETFAKVLVALYVESVLDLLEADEVFALDEAGQAYGIADWRASARKKLDAQHSHPVDPEFIRKSYRLCRDYLVEDEALAFLLRGFGCPSPTELVLLREQFVSGQL